MTTLSMIHQTSSIYNRLLNHYNRIDYLLTKEVNDVLMDKHPGLYIDTLNTECTTTMYFDHPEFTAEETTSIKWDYNHEGNLEGIIVFIPAKIREQASIYDVLKLVSATSSMVVAYREMCTIQKLIADCNRYQTLSDEAIAE